MTTKTRSNNTAKLFVLSSILGLLLSLIFWLGFGYPVFEIQMHDTYFVFASYRVFILFSLFVGIWAFIYYLTPKIIRKNLNSILSSIHFWVTMAGLSMLVIFHLFPSFHGDFFANKHYNFNQGDFEPFKFPWFNNLGLFGVILFILAQLLFFVNLFYSLLKKKN